MYVSLNKRLKFFQNWFGLYISFARKRLEDILFQMFLWVQQCVLGNILPVGYGLSGPALK